MKKLGQKGFGAIELILVLVLVGIIAGAGWYVYQSQKKTNQSLDSANQNVEKLSEANKTLAGENKKKDETAYVSVVQKDGTVKSETPSAVAKTEDQKAILEAVHKTCKDPNTNIAINYEFPTSTSVFKQSGSHVWLNTSCYNPNLSLDEQGSGQGTYLRKADNVWVVDARSQMGYPSCNDVDGKGYPKAIVSECLLSDGATRAPK